MAAYDDAGRPVVGQVGELVITQPMPSMPVGFWHDPGGVRYRESYFDTYPGVWRHGDWIEVLPDGGCVIYGRSDATFNRGGVRMGTSEFYRVVEGFGEIADSLVVDTGRLGAEGRLILFVVPAAGGELDDDLAGRLRAALRSQLSPRHVPDEIRQVPGIPRTLSGKKLEVPVRKILLGTEPERAADPGALANPEVLAYFRGTGPFPGGPGVAPPDQHSAPQPPAPGRRGYLKRRISYKEVAEWPSAGGAPGPAHTTREWTMPDNNADEAREALLVKAAQAWHAMTPPWTSPPWTPPPWFRRAQSRRPGFRRGREPDTATRRGRAALPARLLSPRRHRGSGLALAAGGGGRGPRPARPAPAAGPGPGPGPRGGTAHLDQGACAEPGGGHRH